MIYWEVLQPSYFDKGQRFKRYFEKNHFIRNLSDHVMLVYLKMNLSVCTAVYLHTWLISPSQSKISESCNSTIFFWFILCFQFVGEFFFLWKQWTIYYLYLILNFKSFSVIICRWWLVLLACLVTFPSSSGSAQRGTTSTSWWVSWLSMISSTSSPASSSLASPTFSWCKY